MVSLEAALRWLASYPYKPGKDLGASHSHGHLRWARAWEFTKNALHWLSSLHPVSRARVTSSSHLPGRGLHLIFVFGAPLPFGPALWICRSPHCIDDLFPGTSCLCVPIQDQPQRSTWQTNASVKPCGLCPAWSVSTEPFLFSLVSLPHLSPNLVHFTLNLFSFSISVAKALGYVLIIVLIITIAY